MVQSDRARATAQRRTFVMRIAPALLACAFMLVSGCASDGLIESADTGPSARKISMFVVSTRKGERPPASEVAVEGAPRLSLQMISVPPGHETSKIERPAFGSEDPKQHFVVVSRRGLDETGFVSEIAAHISGRIGSNRDILLHVHGFNTSYDEARFRLAQVADDGRFGGVPVLFTWPSAGSVLDYGAAKESATASRDALAKLIRQLSETPGVGRVHILAHSMGAWLTMEALRENAIAGGPGLNGKLGDVMLAAPDIDLSVFRQQIARIDASHVFVLVSANDRALSISRTLAGDRPRLGALDPNRPADRAALEELGVKVYDLSQESAGLIGHGAYGDAPQVVRTIGAQIAEPRPQDANVQAVLGDKPVDSRIIATPLAPASAAPQ
ncbi:alpha/beta hydrolase [Methylocapsa acidiphila]|uniref:alpha/beta hydrolase n=1 Tax=Methylocapsa acidiphila TaxID=133552 RepID=UPI0004094C16|nr:alpha/beta fold hydrolase [Methylocapsa acidiphila]